MSSSPRWNSSLRAFLPSLEPTSTMFFRCRRLAAQPRRHLPNPSARFRRCSPNLGSPSQKPAIAVSPKPALCSCAELLPSYTLVAPSLGFLTPLPVVDFVSTRLAPPASASFSYELKPTLLYQPTRPACEVSEPAVAHAATDGARHPTNGERHNPVATAPRGVTQSTTAFEAACKHVTQANDHKHAPPHDPPPAPREWHCHAKAACTIDISNHEAISS